MDNQHNQGDIARCQWPQLPGRFDTALREAVSFILENHDPVGIIASGTIIRGNPDPTSDLDIYVIHLGNYRQRVQRFFNGVPAEIFINPPHKVEDYFKQEQEDRRPLTAHMLATGFVVLDLDPVVETLRDQAALLLDQPPPAPEDTTIQRYMIALLYEDGVDIADNDPEAATMILSQAVGQMLQFRFIQAGAFIPRHKSLLLELGKLDPELAELARGYYQAVSIQQRVQLATDIADRTVTTRGFFEWAYPPEMLKPSPGSLTPNS